MPFISVITGYPVSKAANENSGELIRERKIIKKYKGNYKFGKIACEKLTDIFDIIYEQGLVKEMAEKVIGSYENIDEELVDEKVKNLLKSMVDETFDINDYK